MSIPNKDLCGDPGKIVEALELQDKAWKAIAELGRDNIPWAKKNRKFLVAYQPGLAEIIDGAKADDESSLIRLVHGLYSANDAEGKVNEMLFNMAGAFIDKETGQGIAVKVICGSKKCLEFVEKARKYDKAREGKA